MPHVYIAFVDGGYAYRIELADGAYELVASSPAAPMPSHDTVVGVMAFALANVGVSGTFVAAKNEDEFLMLASAWAINLTELIIPQKAW